MIVHFTPPLQRDDKFRVIDYRTLVKDISVNTFSPEIELFAANIPGLSDKFILANDDSFVLNKIKPSFFFNRNKPVFNEAARKTYYDDEISFINIIENRGIKNKNKILSNTMQGFIKTDYKDSLDLLMNDIKNYLSQNVSNYVDHKIISYFLLNTDKCDLKHKEFNMPDFMHGVTERFKIYKYETLALYDKYLNYAELNPFFVKILTIKDIDKTDYADRAEFVYIFEKLFPKQSKFEIPVVKNEIKNKKHLKNSPIDLVYLWVDGSEENWKKKKEFWASKYDLRNTNNEPEKYQDNDELKYSLRSVEKNMPWVRNIYIVTDNQIPHWLDKEHPKIHIIDHKDIIPEKYLPTFNSNAIEIHIANIKGLSENFIYANDDMFVMKKVPPEFFFENNKAKVRFYGYVNENGDETLLYSYKLYREKIGDTLNFGPNHNFDAMKKSDFLEYCAKMETELEDTKLQKFRFDPYLQRIGIPVFMVKEKDNEYINIAREQFLMSMSFKNKIRYFLTGKKYIDSYMSCNGFKDIKTGYDNYSPTLFCLENCINKKKSDYRAAKRFLQKNFPEKSKFEK